MSQDQVESFFAAIGKDDFLVDLGLGEVGASSLVSDLFEQLIDTVLQIASQNSEQYDMVADQVELGGTDGLRAKIGPAVMRDMADYDPRRMVGAAKGRERLFWLAVALGDRVTPEGQVDLQPVLQRAFESACRAYFPIYRRFAETIGREPLDGTDEQAFRRLQLLIHIFLEGVTAAQRSGQRPSQDDVVTAVLALFHAFTRRPGEDPFDLEAALVEGAAGVSRSHSAAVTSAEGEEASYGLAADAVSSLRCSDPGLIQYASLHGLSGASRRHADAPESIQGLRRSVLDLLGEGWKLHRLTTIHSEEDLEREIEIAADLRSQGKVRVHATVGGVGGHAAAISVDGHFVILGLDEPHSSYVGRAVCIDEAPVVSFWAEHFRQVFDDRRHTLVIAGPGGLDQGGIAELRRRVRGLARLMGDAPTTVELTERQRQIIECLGRTPRPQLQEIANELIISRDAVKKHCEKLHDKFGIPPGGDRLGPLVEELRRRGLV